jgi:Fibronectin type III domain
MFLCAIFLSDPPGPPLNLRVSSYSNDFVSLAWDAPESDGGAPVIQYVVEKSDITRGGSDNWVVAGTLSATDRSFKATELFPGNSYRFRVTAENCSGTGAAAELKDTIIARLPYGVYTT